MISTWATFQKTQKYIVMNLKEKKPSRNEWNWKNEWMDGKNNENWWKKWMIKIIASLEWMNE
jgi:hypothetical protein